MSNVPNIDPELAANYAELVKGTGESYASIADRIQDPAVAAYLRSQASNKTSAKTADAETAGDPEQARATKPANRRAKTADAETA